MINSCDIIANPNIAEDQKAVNASFSKHIYLPLRSLFTSTNTGCATCDTVPDTNVLAIVSHLKA